MTVTDKMLALKTAGALSLTAVVVVLCYFFVDQPLAWFVHNHSLFRHESLEWPMVASATLKHFAVLAILVVIAWWLWKPGGRLQTVLLAISANLVVTTLLKQALKWGFGRYWPETWSQNNPSLIGSGDYGFHPFHSGIRYESFPSGHAAVIFSVVSILWISYPQWRWIYATICVGLGGAMVGLNFHFASDVIAGGTLGWITGVYMAWGFRLPNAREKGEHRG